VNINLEELSRSLPERRWFGAKHRTIESLAVIDQVVASDADPCVVLSLIRVSYEDGEREVYHLPLIVRGDEQLDAFDDIEQLKVLGDLFAHGTSLHGINGVFHFSGAGLNPLDPAGRRSVRVLGAEQSNSSLVLDEEVIVKLFRRVESGSNPDIELNRLLTAQDSDFVPHHLGDIYYEGTLGDEEVSFDLGIAQQFIADGCDGWEHVLDEVRKLYDDIHPEDVREDIRFLIEDRASGLLSQIEDLGAATGAMHVALSREEEDVAFHPEPMDNSDLKELVVGATQLLRRQIEEGVEELNDLEAAICQKLEELLELNDPGSKIRIHGDYHLAQVLWTQRGWKILDFEGEPARGLEERNEKQSPLKDASGMLRSFGYAALSVLFERAEPGTDEWRRLQPWAEMWEQLARERFLSAYVGKSHEGRFLPSHRDELYSLIHFFEIDKALYEVGYERAHRPEWMRIPLRGIARLIDREGAE
jgi:trehalose synthase-fused probable maltokinase